MKRYWHDDNDECPDPNGDWVLHSEAQAEIERLRGLVRDAYMEGCTMECEDWEHSDTKAELAKGKP